MKRSIKYYFVFFFSFLFLGLVSQNETKKWYFGTNAGLDFMTAPPTILNNGSMVVLEGCASVADGSGNLLFYTDGGIVWNKVGAQMMNGAGITGTNTSGQAALIVKQPGSANIYFLFTTSGQGTAGGFSYSIIDMSLAAGMGSVTVKNSNLSQFGTEKLTGTKHCNGIDYWIVSHDHNSNNFRAYLLTSAGVNPMPVLSPIGTVNAFATNPIGGGTQGHMKLSGNGKKLALAIADIQNFELYDFDNATGVVSNSLILISNLGTTWSVEFSPDCSKLYGTKGPNNFALYQWDLCAGTNSAIIGSQQTVGTSTAGLVGLQLASDGKIYLSRQNKTDLGVINSPNTPGSGCNYVNIGQSIFPNTADWSLPNFISSDFISRPQLSPFTYTSGNYLGCQTASFNAPAVNNLTVTACSVAGYSVSSVLWNFGDPSSGANNTSTLNSPLHTFSSLGTYTTQLILYYSCGGGTDTLRQTVNINQSCFTIGSTSITCANLGSATVTPLTGTGPYSYTWVPTGQNNSIANGLSPGTYTVKVFDPGNNFTYSATTVFTSLIPLTGSLNITPSITCNGASTGTANYTNIGGGSANQNYLWTNGLLTYTTPNPGNLSAGSWSSTVTDALTGCMMSNTFVITQPPTLTIMISGSNQGACAVNTVGLAGIVAGGTSPYSYSWNAGPLLPNYTASPNPGSVTVYSLTAFDFYNCSIVGTILINSAPAPTVTQNSTVLCQGENFSFSVNNGFTYTWIGPQSYSSILQTNFLSSVQPNQTGVYQLTLTAANGCTASANASLIVNPTPTLSALGNTVCTSQTMSLSANSVAGANYSWSGPQSFSSNSQNISIASPALNQSGTYTVLATSIDGCTNTALVLVSVVSPPDLTIALSSSSMCAQALSGSPNTIILNSSGASTYTLSTPSHISNSNPSGPASPLSLVPPYNQVGVSSATLVGSNGVCSAVMTATFNIVPNPTVSVSSPTPIICAGQSFTYTSSGAASYTWTTANPANFIYTSGSVAVGNPSINSVFSVIGGSLGCLSALQSSTITVNALPVFNILGNALICANTSAILSANGTGTSYTWAPSFFLNTSNGATVAASPPALQNYVVTGSLNNCTTTAMITVSVLPLPVAIITAPKTTFCQNDEILLFGSGGSQNGIGAYFWNGPANYAATGQNLHLTAISAAYGGTYTLTVSDQNNCKASATQIITVNSLPQGYLSSDHLKGCAPLCADLAFKTIPGSAMITNYNWVVNNINVSGSTFKYCFNSPGDYQITGDISDINNCVNTITTVVNVYSKPKANFSFTPDQPVENFDEVQFTDTSKEAVQYNWSFGNTSFSSDQKNPRFLYENAGYYPVALVVQNKWLCSDTVIKVVYVAPDFAVYVPNTFTPNEDGLNEIFIPVMRGSKAFTFTIFDRWGAKVFETSEITKGWDGTFKGEVCKQGVYVWQLNVSGESAATSNTGKQEKNLKGEVLLYR